MEFKITTRHILVLLQVISWIIFIGLCVEAGVILFRAAYIFVRQPADTLIFWEGAVWNSLYQYDQGQFMVMNLFMFIVAVLKASLFCLIVKLLANRELSSSHPFSPALRRFLGLVSWLALGIGLFCHYGSSYGEWLSTHKVMMPDLQAMHLGGADVWLFMAVLLFAVAQLVKRGIEIQTENDLTI